MCFDSCNDVKLHIHVTGVQYGIKYGVGWLVADILGTCLDVDPDGIIIGLDNILRVAMMANLTFVWQEYNMVSMLVSVDVLMLVRNKFLCRCIWNNTYYWWSNRNIFLYRYFEGFNDVNIEGLVRVV